MSARASCRVPIIIPKIVCASVRAASASVGLRRDAMSSMLKARGKAHDEIHYPAAELADTTVEPEWLLRHANAIEEQRAQPIGSVIVGSLRNGFLVVPDPEDPDPQLTAFASSACHRVPHRRYEEPL